MQSKPRSTAAVQPAVSYPEIVGSVVKQLRTLCQLDQARLASAVGVAQPTWSRVENGAIPISVEQLGIIAPVLGIQPSEILRRADLAAAQFAEQGIQVTPRRSNPSGIDDDGRAFLKGAAVVALLAAIFSK